MPSPRKRKWALFGNRGVRHAVDLERVTRVELSKLAVAGELDPPERLYVYSGGGEPLTVVAQEDIGTLLRELGLEGLADA
jgi:hypothetical protein